MLIFFIFWFLFGYMTFEIWLYFYVGEITVKDMIEGLWAGLLGPISIVLIILVGIRDNLPEGFWDKTLIKRK